jgi:hypothetical protein
MRSTLPATMTAAPGINGWGIIGSAVYEDAWIAGNAIGCNEYPLRASTALQLVEKDGEFRISDWRCPILAFNKDDVVEQPQPGWMPVIPERNVDFLCAEGVKPVAGSGADAWQQFEQVDDKILKCLPSGGRSV